MSEIRIASTDIEKNLITIQEALDVKVSADLPSEIMAQLTQLSHLLGLSSVVQASARFHLEFKRRSAVATAHKMGYAGNMARDYINGMCAEELGLYELAERQNRALVHQIESYRSILSYAKSELQNIR